MKVKDAHQHDSTAARMGNTVPPGIVQVEPHGDGWLLVSIGRARYTKRFNLSSSEAVQLIEALAIQVSEYS